MEQGLECDEGVVEAFSSEAEGGKVTARDQECDEDVIEAFSSEAVGGRVTTRDQQCDDGVPGREKPWEEDNDDSGCGGSITGTEDRLVPPDGGWGWLVAGGCFIITTLLPSLSPCFGVLFSHYLLEHGTSSTTTAWIFNTQGLYWNLSGLLARPLSQELGWKRVGLLGSAVSASGLIICAFAPSPGFLFFSFSLLTGFGGGLAAALCFTILPHYFNRKRGLANAIMMAGVCMGQIVGPPVTRLLQEEYGNKGATMILGAIFLNACVGASLFQPPEWHKKPCIKLGEAEEEEEGEKPLVNKDYKLDITQVLLHSDSNLRRAESAPGDLEPHLSGVIARSQVSKSKAVRRFSGASYASTFSISTLDVAGIGVLPVEIEGEKEEAKGNSSGVCSVICRMVRSIITDLGVLRSPRACIVCLGGTLCINGYLNFMMMVPFAMVSGGYSLDTAAWCLSASAVCNLVMRILVSSLSDARWFKIRLVYMTGFLVISASMFAFPLVQSASWLLVTMAMFGCGLGSNMGIYNLVMIDVMGLDLLAPVFGTGCLCVGIGFICLGPLIGFIRDWSGSYTVSIWFTSFMLLLGFLSWLLLMPLAIRYDRRRSRKQEEKGNGYT